MKLLSFFTIQYLTLKFSQFPIYKYYYKQKINIFDFDKITRDLLVFIDNHLLITFRSFILFNLI